MRKIAVITVGRSDYGILRPLLRRLAQSEKCELQLVVGGMHFHKRQGMTIQEIREDGFPIASEVPIAEASGGDGGITDSFAEAVCGFGRAYARLQPDLIVVLGDRFEMFAAATAAVFAGKPLAHLHGGELTQGAIDDVMRHAITKMSHLHFASTESYARRILQMGEEPWRVHASGAMALDNLNLFQLLSVEELQEKIGISFEGTPLVATLHPPTLERIDLDCLARDFAESLAATGRTVILTAPNTDPGGEQLHRRLFEEARNHARLHFVESLGTLNYFSLMACAEAMVGNSSSGILEAASFRLPVVNIGRRQEGRVQAANVINCGNSREEIDQAVGRALSEEFQHTLAHLVNPYGDGHAAERIAEVLLDVSLNERLLCKRFFDTEGSVNSFA